MWIRPKSILSQYGSISSSISGEELSVFNFFSVEKKLNTKKETIKIPKKVTFFKLFS